MDTREHIHDEIVAYLEGELTAEQAARVEESLRTSGDYAREYEWLRSVYASLESAGVAYEAKAPEVDLTGAILAEVFKIENQPKVLVSPRKPRSWWQQIMGPIDWRFATATVAAMLVLGYALFSGVLTSKNSHDKNVATKDQANPSGVVNPSTKDKVGSDSRSKLALAQEKKESAKKNLDKFASGASADGGNFESTKPPNIDGQPTVSDIVLARRDAASGGAGLAKLVEWATIKREDAQRVIDSADASPQAMISAANSLSQADEEQVLLTAVGILPDDPYARFELAKSYSEDPQKATEAIAQLQAMPDLDQENALPYYLKAKLLLEQGDAAGALEALAVAQSKRSVSAYTRESAQAKVQALIAAGIPEDQAKMLSAMTAGTDQYSYLNDLGKSLIDYGRNYMASQDYETAGELFDAARTLGQQVQDGASFSQEQLAGLDIQSQALDALQELYGQTGTTEQIEELANQTLDLVASIEGLDGIFTALQQLFTTDYGEDIWNTVSGLVLSYGDINIFSYLNQMGITIPGVTN